ncbi:MAG: aminopeptidase N [Propionibacteriales bacterium]|jgi:aminopeptidase N|nr:aminopeptidase N [Propionibacteriales bacterium]
MPGINLTRGEAGERARILDVASYDISLDLTTSDTTFGSTTVVTFSCSEPGASSFVDLVGATVREITLNGRSIDPAAYVDSRIELTDLGSDNELRVAADCTYSRTGEGLHRFVDPVDDRVYLYTQFEVPDARRVYTTFEQPDLKATFTFDVTAPSHWQVVSNSPTPEPQDLGRGTSRWHFEPTKPMSTYITAVVAGEYAVVRDTYRGQRGEIPLGIFLRQSLVPHLDHDDIFEVTKQGFAYFEGAFDMAYPFGKYDQLFVPEYNMGAMENAGCVTFRDEYIYRSRQTQAAYQGRANTILHEMAHMWFGDLVTMKWWDDLWLNESFAEWASHEACTDATKYSEAWTNFCNARKTWAYRQDQLPSTHPVAADNHDLEAVEVNFDGITYAKGASALRQLVAWVGPTHFLDGLRTYFDRHAYGNSELTDLLKALEETSGRELGSWTKEWLQTSGVNTLRPAFEVDDNDCFTSFTVQQSAHPDFPTLRRHRLAVGLYDLTDDALVRRSSTEIDVSGEDTHVDELVGAKRPDLVLLNDGDLTYAKVRLDERSLATLVDRIDKFQDSLARALAWGAAWDMTRDAEMGASDWVSLVLRGIAVESDQFAVRSLVARTGQAISQYTAPANRAAVALRWEAGLVDLLRAAQPGSDEQLAFTRGLARAAHSDASLDLLTSLLDGSRPLAGLVVDTDLRWLILTGLAREARADDDDIDSELDRDNTISGQESAAAARAAMPTAEAKEHAWSQAVERDDIANETMRSIALSFNQPGQEEVLRPYLERYLTAAESIWETRGVHHASTVLSHMFPREVATQETLATTDAWLAASKGNPAARRLVSEGRADVARALAAQAYDAPA